MLSVRLENDNITSNNYIFYNSNRINFNFYHPCSQKKNQIQMVDTFSNNSNPLCYYVNPVPFVTFIQCNGINKAYIILHCCVIGT